MPATVHTERRGAVLIIRMDDPRRLNAYDGTTLHDLAAAGGTLDGDTSLRAAVLTGAGGEFCAGADVGAVASGGFADGPYPEIAEGLAAKPVIAAIEGHCLGGGMMVATGCDLRVAGRSATFGLPESRWNYPAQWLGALARQVLPAHALELALLGDERPPAARLYEMGWLSRVVDDGTALDVAVAWAQRLAALAPGALVRFKELITVGNHASPTEALELGHRHSTELMAMADTVEGGRAFAEGRTPRFEGR